MRQLERLRFKYATMQLLNYWSRKFCPKDVIRICQNRPEQVFNNPLPNLNLVNNITSVASKKPFRWSIQVISDYRWLSKRNSDSRSRKWKNSEVMMSGCRENYIQIKENWRKQQQSSCRRVGATKLKLIFENEKRKGWKGRYREYQRLSAYRGYSSET